MDRRTFIGSVVSIGTAAISGCTNGNTCERPDSETQNCQAKKCEQCEKLEQYSNEILNTEYAKDKRVSLEELLRPEIHDWSDGCRFGQCVDDERIPSTREFFEEMDYDFDSQFNERRGLLEVSLNIHSVPLRVDSVNAVVTVGE